jgi:diguanylate cyclase (GGDEF)-like protein/PAS domain S-box-containing protein
VVDVQLAWTLLRDESGQPSYLTLVLIDMTERRRQQELLAASEARFRARFEQSSVAQVMAGTDGRITAVNAAFCALLGRSPEQLVGVGNAALHHAQDDGRGDAELAAVLSGEHESARYERLLSDAAGRPLPVLVDITLLRDAEGEPDEIALTVFDLRTLRDVERRREQQEQFFLAVSQRASDLALVADADATILFASEATRHMFGYEADEVIAHLGWDFVHPDDLPTAQAAFEQVVTAGGSGSFTVRVRDAAGRWRWVEETMTNMLETPVGGIVANLHDVTERVEAEQALRESEARYRLIADTAEEGILAAAPDGSCLYANARMAAMLGLPLSDLYARPLPSLLEPAEAAEMLRRLREREGGQPDAYEIRYLHPDGGERRLWIAASPMLGPDGVHQGSLGMVSDVTELRRTEEQLRRAALHDALTGLPNRTLLTDRLDQALSREAASAGRGTAVVLLDLDDFKLVNDSRGHAVGDALLVAVVERLCATARPLDTVARFGGDEFVVVCEDVDEATALSLAESLLAALREPFDVDGNVLHVSASFGVARSPGSAAADLLRFADAAMYAAKDGGRGRVALFDRPLADEAERRYALAADLRVALEQDRLRLNYQPVVDLGSGRVVGMEALARWEHPELGDISPARFVAVAEQTGLAVLLDAWAVRQALHDAAALRDGRCHRPRRHRRRQPLGAQPGARGPRADRPGGGRGGRACRRRS